MDSSATRLAPSSADPDDLFFRMGAAGLVL
jgi:hypothetical protein